MAKKIESSLTAEQIERLAEWREKWLRVGLCKAMTYHWPSLAGMEG